LIIFLAIEHDQSSDIVPLTLFQRTFKAPAMLESADQALVKRDREDSSSTLSSSLTEPEPKKRKTDHRGFYNFNTDKLASDDGEDFDDVGSETDDGQPRLL
jgi:hypothetical protein